VWVGPSGIDGYDRFVWTRDGHAVVALVNDGLITVDAETRAEVRYRRVPGIARLWTDALQVRKYKRSLTLFDIFTRRAYTAGLMGNSS
jgi:hypothetical protein